MDFLSFLYQNVVDNFSYKMIAMWVIGGLLIYLAIKKDMEPTLLLPMGFGVILVNLPLSGVIDQTVNGLLQRGPLSVLYDAGIANELFPLLLFIGAGAMIDFGPILSNPKLMIFGAAAQFGIFFTLCTASMFFDLKDAASIAVIGAADGPTSIVVAMMLNSKYLGAIMVAAYSYMALIPIIQPPIMKLLTTKKERQIRMTQLRKVSKKEKIIFPIAVTTLVGLILPSALPLLGMLMLGNLLKECCVADRLKETASNALLNIITIFLGVCVGAKADGATFLTWDSLKIVSLGLAAFCLGTCGGVLMVKVMNLFSKNKMNPLIGSAGVSAVPMAARVSQKVGQEEVPDNYLLMHAMGPNVAGVIGSAVAAGVLLSLFL